MIHILPNARASSEHVKHGRAGQGLSRSSHAFLGAEFISVVFPKRCSTANTHRLAAEFANNDE